MELPLSGRRLLVTRRPAQAARLSERLRDLGADVVEIPAIEIVAPEDRRPLDDALSRLAEYNWLILTSTNAVRATVERLEHLCGHRGITGPPPALAAVGPATADALRELTGRSVERLPESDFTADGLLSAFSRGGRLNGQRLLIPAADRARETLSRGLRDLGGQVDVVVAYRTVAPPDLPAMIAERLTAGIDLALFASPSAVENFAAAAGPCAREVPTVVMGPVTERAARILGFDVRGAASPSTLEGLVAATLAALASPSG